jgi:flagellar protein FliO/FliZ
MNYEPEMLTTIAKMIFLMTLLIGGLWGVAWLSKNKLQGSGLRSTGKKIKVIESCHIGVKKTILLVQVPGTILVLGSTADNLALLSEIKEPALSEIYLANQNIPEQSPFSMQLKRFSTKFGKEE